MLKHFAAAQEQFRAAGHVDRDADGRGEYGLIAELGAHDATRLTHPLPNMLLSGGYWEREEDGRFLRSGYYYRLYLPRKADEWVPASLSRISDEDADAAEKRFLCIAWPASYGNSGKRCFFIDQGGVVSAATNRTWKLSGRDKPLTPALTMHPDWTRVP